MLTGNDSTKSPSSTQTNSVNKQRKPHQVSSSGSGSNGGDDPIDSSNAAPPSNNGGYHLGNGNNEAPPSNIAVYKKPPGSSSGGRSRASRSMAKKQRPTQHHNRLPPTNIAVYSNQRNGLPPPPPNPSPSSAQQQEQLSGGPPPSAINVYNKRAIPQSILAFNSNSSHEGPVPSPSPLPPTMGVDASSVGANSNSSYGGGVAATVGGASSVDNSSSYHPPMPPGTYQFNQYQQQPQPHQQQYHNMYQQQHPYIQPHQPAAVFQSNSSVSQPLPPSTNTAFPPAKATSPTSMSNQQQPATYSTMQQQQQQQQFSLYQQQLQQQQQQLQQQLQHNLQQQQLMQQQQQHQMAMAATGHPSMVGQHPQPAPFQHHAGSVVLPQGQGPMVMMGPGPNGMIPNHQNSGNNVMMMPPQQHQQQQEQPYMSSGMVPAFAGGMPQPPGQGGMGGGMMMHQQQPHPGAGVQPYQQPSMVPHQYQQQPHLPQFPMGPTTGPATMSSSPANSTVASPMTMMNPPTPGTVMESTSAMTGASSVTATTVMTTGVTTTTSGGMTPPPAPKSASKQAAAAQGATAGGQMRRRRRRRVAASDSSYNSKQKEYNLSLDYIPGQLDIVIGRHKNAYNHLGNRRFRVTILKFLPQYIERPKRKERTSLIMKMVELIRLNGGHFVKWDDTRNCWVDIGDKQARNKVGHALRDAACVRSGGGSVSEISSLASGGPSSFAPSAGSTSNADLLDVTPLISPEDAGLLPSSGHVPSTADSVTTGGTSMTNHDDEDDDDFDDDEDDGDESSVDIDFDINLDGRSRHHQQHQTSDAQEGLLAQWRNGHRRTRRRRSSLSGADQQHQRGEGKDDHSARESTTGSRAASSGPVGMLAVGEDAAVPTTIQGRSQRNSSGGSKCSRGSAESGRSRTSRRSHNSSVSGNKRRMVKTVVISGLSAIDPSSSSLGSQGRDLSPGRKRIATANRCLVSSSGRPRSSARHTTNAVCDGSDDDNGNNDDDEDEDDDHPMQPMVTMRSSPPANGASLQQQQSGTPVPAVAVRVSAETPQQPTNGSGSQGYGTPGRLPPHHARDGAGAHAQTSSSDFFPSYQGGDFQHLLPSFVPPKAGPRHSPSAEQMPPPPAAAPMMDSDDDSLLAQQRYGQHVGVSSNAIQFKKNRRKQRKQRGVGVEGVDPYYAGEIGLSSDDDMFDHGEGKEYGEGAIDHFALAEMAKGTNEAWGGLASSTGMSPALRKNGMNGNVGYVSSPVGTYNPMTQESNGGTAQTRNRSDPSPPGKSSDDSSATPVTANILEENDAGNSHTLKASSMKNGVNRGTLQRSNEIGRSDGHLDLCGEDGDDDDNVLQLGGSNHNSVGLDHLHHHHHHHLSGGRKPDEQHWNGHVMDMLVPAFHPEDDTVGLVKSDVDEFMTCPSDKE